MVCGEALRGEYEKNNLYAHAGIRNYNQLGRYANMVCI